MTEPTRRQVLRSTALVGGTVLAGCSSGDSEDTPEGGNGDGASDWVQTSTVEMTDELTFVPERIEVSSGTTVTWENVGTIGHTVTAYGDEIPDGAEYFASGAYESEEAAADAYQEESGGNIAEGETYEHTFETKGTYEYYCIPHEMNGMVGSVKVV